MTFEWVTLSNAKDTKTRIIVNNNQSKSIDIKRGTKQGDPISPTLFILVLEPLNRSIIEDKI